MALPKTRTHLALLTSLIWHHLQEGRLAPCCKVSGETATQRFAKAGLVRPRVPLIAIHHERTGELATIVTIRMFVAILPVCSLLSPLQLVKGTINLMPFRSPVPVPAVFAVVPSMVVPVVAVVVPPLVSFVPLSGILTAVVSKVVACLEPHRGNKSHG